MSSIGHYSLIIALVLSAYAFIVSLWAARTRSTILLETVQRSILAIFALVSLASFALLYALLTRDFSIEYVAQYSSRGLSTFYTISAFWAGQAGSLLFWTLLLSIFAVVVVVQNRGRNPELIPYALSAISLTTFFFLYLATFKTSPFATTSHVPADGHGLNPLLQNIEMIFHPPTLYVGFVAFTVPFAFAIAALASGRLDDQWIKSIRRWTLFAWLFLTIGNLLGAQWAYVELGWGGYWAWDPVENSSLLPWLTGTAFLHSVVAQERKGLLKVWNMSLVIITFALTIFGTFVTRSGIISSVHAYAVSNLGVPFLDFLFLVLTVSATLLIMRLKHLKAERQIHSWSSKESGFLLNNLIFMALAFAVFWGTILPTISEAIRGKKITVGPEFFNKFSVPVGIALLLLIGICPLLSWGKTSIKRLLKNFALPGGLTFIAAVTLFALGINHPASLITFVFALFVLIIITAEFIRGARARSRNSGLGFARSLVSITTQHRRRYGGYIVHLGVVLLFIGIAGSSAFKQEQTATLNRGEVLTIANFNVRFDSLRFENDSDKQIAKMFCSAKKNGKDIGVITSEKIFQTNYQPVTDVGIRSSLSEDLYMILAGYSGPDSVTLKVLVNPLVIWMWIGGIVMVLGTLLAIFPSQSSREVFNKTMLDTWVLDSYN